MATIKKQASLVRWENGERGKEKTFKPIPYQHHYYTSNKRICQAQIDKIAVFIPKKFNVRREIRHRLVYAFRNTRKGAGKGKCPCGHQASILAGYPDKIKTMSQFSGNHLMPAYDKVSPDSLVKESVVYTGPFEV